MIATANPPTRSATAVPSTSHGRYAPHVLSIVRIMAALLFLEHGLSKFFGFPSATAPHPILFDLEWFAALIETAGGILLALGLFTRAAAFIMSGEMAIGYFTARVLPLSQPRRGCDPLLLRLSLFRFCRRRTVEPRRLAVAQDVGRIACGLRG